MATLTSREAALIALIEWQKRGTFLWDSLDGQKSRLSSHPSDLNFAYELACGTCRQWRYLEMQAKRVVVSLPKKPLERILLYLGLYQRFFCPNIPAYAVVDSMVSLAKRYTYPAFASFLNATLRKEIEPRQDFLSYTDFFIKSIFEQYGEACGRQILEQQNLPTPLHTTCYNGLAYIQNRTQIEIMSEQAKRLAFEPKTILDLCAAPGGKTLLLSLLFPRAKIVANEVAASKLPILKENFDKYGCPATVANFDGREFQWGHPFDLIVVDAPCSNSGVLYKCPEARWRIEEKEIERLTLLQQELLLSAAKHLFPNGRIWYQTCSILRQENEWLAAQLPLEIAHEPILQLPDANGHEGGFSCSLRAT